MLFSGYVLLDTFLIPRAYERVSDAESGVKADKETEENDDAKKSEISGETEPDREEGTEEKTEVDSGEKSFEISDSSETDAVFAAGSLIGEYVENGTEIHLYEFRYLDTNVYVADVKAKSADVLKTALAQDIYGKNVTDKTSSIAEEHGAILAINGDFYGTRERGYVIRNGVLYRSESAGSDQEDLVISKDGTFEIRKEDETSAEDLVKEGARQVFSFGPALVTDGEVSVSKGEEVGRAMASNPRTAIGQMGENHYLFVVSDGRTRDNAGLSLSELADFMKDLKVKTAYNLDGGGSSTMYFKGEVINHPTTSGRGGSRERSVSDIVCIGG